jgi:hypothetical protein
MYWIIQENLWNEEGFNTLLQALKKNNSDYQIVKVRPFIHTIEPDITPPYPTMVIGSTTLVQIGKSRGWNPNAFINGNFDFRVQNLYYGKHMLNSDAVVGQLGTIEPIWDEFFIRPPEDSKAFTGQVMTRSEFEKWRGETETVYGDGFTQITPYSEVMIASLKTILQEFRLFVVGRKVVTGSQYRQGGRPYQSPTLDVDVIDFAESLCDRWTPATAFCLDIARTDNGLKAIEINCLNSAGWYKSDVSKIIQALECLYA